MKEDFNMEERTYIIKDELGIHARPAGLLVKEASKFQSDVKIKAGNREADAKRLFSIMGLGIKKGDSVSITANGADELEAIAAMVSFFETNL